MAPRSFRGRVGMSRDTSSVSKSLVRQMIRSTLANKLESKIVQGGASGNMSTTGNIVGLTNIIVQDDTVAGRTGDKVTLVSCHIKFQATINASATSDRARVIVVVDTSNQNTLPSVTDVLATAALNSFLNVGNLAAGRFKVLYDQTYQLNTQGSAGMFRTFSIPVKGLNVFFNTTTGYGKNNLYLIEISDTPTNLATFALSTEVRYTDA